jgi:putative aldouronate transport system substrate-binding protein
MKKVAAVALSLVIAAGLVPAITVQEVEARGAAAPIRWWAPLHSSVAGLGLTFDVNISYQAMQEATGIQVQWVHPPEGDVTAAFNLMLAAGDLTDIIEHDAIGAWGDRVIDEAIVVDIWPNLANWAPNYYALLDSRPDLRRDAVTDSGRLTGFRDINHSNTNPISQGVFVRQDWLRELNLRVPRTIEEYVEVLTAFRDRMNVPTPLWTSHNYMMQMWSSAFNVYIHDSEWFYLNEGQVVFGYMQPEARDLVNFMARLHAERLIPDNIFGISNANAPNGVSQATAGMGWGSLGSHMNVAQNNLARTNPNARLVGAPWPVQNIGDTITHMGNFSASLVGNRAAGISTRNRRQQESFALIDWLYTEEGSRIRDIGVEGVTYQVIGGRTVWMPFVYANPDGLEPGQVNRIFTARNIAGPGISVGLTMDAPDANPAAAAAVRLWNPPAIRDTVTPNRLPGGLTLNSRESAEVARIMGVIQPFIRANNANSQLWQFVRGQQPLANWDAFQAQLISMGINEAIGHHQTAMDRFNQR